MQNRPGRPDGPNVVGGVAPNSPQWIALREWVFPAPSGNANRPEVTNVANALSCAQVKSSVTTESAASVLTAGGRVGRYWTDHTRRSAALRRFEHASIATLMFMRTTMAVMPVATVVFVGIGIIVRVSRRLKARRGVIDRRRIRLSTRNECEDG